MILSDYCEVKDVLLLTVQRFENRQRACRDESGVKCEKRFPVCVCVGVVYYSLFHRGSYTRKLQYESMLSEAIKHGSFHGCV